MSITMKSKYPYIYIPYSMLNSELSLRHKAKHDSIHLKRLMKHCLAKGIITSIAISNGNKKHLRLRVPSTTQGKKHYLQLSNSLKAKNALL